jgi:hypothetical protein
LELAPLLTALLHGAGFYCNAPIRTVATYEFCTRAR